MLWFDRSYIKGGMSHVHSAQTRVPISQKQIQKERESQLRIIVITILVITVLDSALIVIVIVQSNLISQIGSLHYPSDY